MIDRFRVKSLCYSELQIWFIIEKNRLVGDAFTLNFIRSSSFERFFNPFSQSILSSLKKLRLCQLRLGIRSVKVFAETLNSFSQLEDLSIRFDLMCDLKINEPHPVRLSTT